MPGRDVIGKLGLSLSLDFSRFDYSFRAILLNASMDLDYSFEFSILRAKRILSSAKVNQQAFSLNFRAITPLKTNL